LGNESLGLQVVDWGEHKDRQLACAVLHHFVGRSFFHVPISQIYSSLPYIEYIYRRLLSLKTPSLGHGCREGGRRTDGIAETFGLVRIRLNGMRSNAKKKTHGVFMGSLDTEPQDLSAPMQDLWMWIRGAGKDITYEEMMYIGITYCPRIDTCACSRC